MLHDIEAAILTLLFNGPRTTRSDASQEAADSLQPLRWDIPSERNDEQTFMAADRIRA